MSGGVAVNQLEFASPAWLAWLRRYGYVIAAYLLVTWLTNAHFMGDTVGYADAILDARMGDFGHLLWYPLGLLLSKLSAPVTVLLGIDARTNVLIVLMTVSWLAGLLSVVMLYNIVRQISPRPWVANVMALAMIAAQGFLNYAQTGCSYLLGLSLLFVGWYLSLTGITEPQRSPRRDWMAGLALAGAVGLWFPYILSVPAVVVSRLVLFGFDASRIRSAVHSAAIFTLAVVLLYGTFATLLGINTPAEFKEWMLSAGHGITNTAGIPRMVFGFARSFINMGRDGMIFKRFIVHDPFNPVSALELFRLSLWKFLLFYAMLGLMTWALFASSQGRCVLGLLVVNSIPVLGFAISWQGGDMERYLPLYPVLFLSAAVALSSQRRVLAFKGLSALVFAMMIVSSANAMAASVIANRERRILARIEKLMGQLNSPHLVATVVQQDEVYTLYHSYPFHPLNKTRSLTVHFLLDPGSTQILRWQQNFATDALAVWAGQGDVWVSKWVLARTPRPEWTWVEGADTRISWTHVYEFFATLEIEREIGGDDGFVLIVPSPNNHAVLNRLKD